MPRKATGTDTEQFTVTLSKQAISMIEELVATGIHGNSRAEVARTLILNRLEDLVAKQVVRLVKRRMT